jgi:hypothetical protein
MGFNDVHIPHGLPFMPLPRGLWTTDSTWQTAYEMNSGPITTSPTAPSPFTFDTGIEANSTEVIFRNQNWTGSTATLYYRIYAFMPSTVNLDAPFTNVGVDNFMINSDYNYTKLYLAGVTAASGVASSTAVVPHNLGYRPQVMAWAERDGTVYDETYTYVNSGVPDSGCDVNINDLTFTRASFIPTTERFHYRIYLDE